MTQWRSIFAVRVFRPIAQLERVLLQARRSHPASPLGVANGSQLGFAEATRYSEVD
jgi:hypothetical protein